MRRLLAGIDGPVLELGCGTGRPLLRWLADGLDVEGIDASADMLAILRRHAAERGLTPTLHHGGFAPLALDRTYAAIVCVAGSFTLIDDREAARPRTGQLLPAPAAGRPAGHHPRGARPSNFDEELAWRLRRTGTHPDGTTYLVHEAIRCDREEQLQVTYNRMETFDADGRLVGNDLRRFHLRWWQQRRVRRAAHRARLRRGGSGRARRRLDRRRPPAVTAAMT